MIKKDIWSKIFLICFVGYILFSVGKVAYMGYQVNGEVATMKGQIEELRQSNKELSDKILYYQSPSYREKIARERMGLQKPGEEVIVILPEERPKVSETNNKDNVPNYLKWWNFFFKG